MRLIQRVAHNDIDALDKLYCKYKTEVYRLAFSILSDYYLAEDVVQETFLKAKINADTFRYGDNERAWIMRIARNTAIDIKRKQNKENLTEIVEKDGKADKTTIAADEEFLNLIRPLSELDKQIVCLHLICKLKHKDIAKVIGMSTAATKKRYERAIKKLREAVEYE